MINLYFDMDGVLAVYDRQAYPPNSNLYCTVGKHYYQTVTPDQRAINAFVTLAVNNKNSAYRQISLHTLSSLSCKGKIFLEQMSDKKKWLCENIKSKHPGASYQTHFAGSQKRYIGEALSDNRKLSRSDILVDDYNDNLAKWEQAGGTSVKYCNGINSSDSWKGFCITEDMSSEEIVNFLEAIATSYNIERN